MNKKKIFIVLQARMGSSRLPGKVLMEINGKPLLWYLLKRLEPLANRADLLLATTDSEKDQVLEEFAKQNRLKYFRGSENDVLDRFYQALKPYITDIVVRITADCPLTDPKIIEQGLDIFESNDYDYLSNVHPPTFPDGFDVEIFSFKALEKAWEEAKKQHEREHVTPYIWNNPSIFKLGNFNNSENLSNYRLTVDEKEDFELMKNLIEHFKEKWINLSMNEIINFLRERQELIELNKKFKRNEGYKES
mgnify:CR=1 FL=1